LNQAGTQISIPVQDTLRAIEAAQISGYQAEHDQVKLIAARVSDLKSSIPAIEHEGLLNKTVMQEIHHHFDFSSDVEYSGFVDLEHLEIEYFVYQGSKCPFPWGPPVVFHTHPGSLPVDEHSYPDLFLFCCSPARISLLFTKHRVSILEKTDLLSPIFDELREKLKFLKSGGHLSSSGPSNSLYFSSVLERKFPEVRMVGSFKKKFSLLCKVLYLRQLTWMMP